MWDTDGILKMCVEMLKVRFVKDTLLTHHLGSLDDPKIVWKETSYENIEWNFA